MELALNYSIKPFPHRKTSQSEMPVDPSNGAYLPESIVSQLNKTKFPATQKIPPFSVDSKRNKQTIWVYEKDESNLAEATQSVLDRRSQTVDASIGPRHFKKRNQSIRKASVSSANEISMMPITQAEQKITQSLLDNRQTKQPDYFSMPHEMASNRGGRDNMSTLANQEDMLKSSRQQVLQSITSQNQLPNSYSKYSQLHSKIDKSQRHAQIDYFNSLNNKNKTATYRQVKAISSKEQPSNRSQNLGSEDLPSRFQNKREVLNNFFNSKESKVKVVNSNLKHMTPIITTSCSPRNTKDVLDKQQLSKTIQDKTIELDKGGAQDLKMQYSLSLSQTSPSPHSGQENGKPQSTFRNNQFYSDLVKSQVDPKSEGLEAKVCKNGVLLLVQHKTGQQEDVAEPQSANLPRVQYQLRKSNTKEEDSVFAQSAQHKSFQHKRKFNCQLETSQAGVAGIKLQQDHQPFNKTENGSFTNHSGRKLICSRHSQKVRGPNNMLNYKKNPSTRDTQYGNRYSSKLKQGGNPFEIMSMNSQDNFAQNIIDKYHPLNQKIVSSQTKSYLNVPINQPQAVHIQQLQFNPDAKSKLQIKNKPEGAVPLSSLVGAHKQTPSLFSTTNTGVKSTKQKIKTYNTVAGIPPQKKSQSVQPQGKLVGNSVMAERTAANIRSKSSAQQQKPRVGATPQYVLQRIGNGVTKTPTPLQMSQLVQANQLVAALKGVNPMPLYSTTDQGLNQNLLLINSQQTPIFQEGNKQKPQLVLVQRNANGEITQMNQVQILQPAQLQIVKQEPIQVQTTQTPQPVKNSEQHQGSHKDHKGKQRVYCQICDANVWIPQDAQMKPVQKDTPKSTFHRKVKPAVPKPANLTQASIKVDKVEDKKEEASKELKTTDKKKNMYYNESYTYQKLKSLKWFGKNEQSNYAKGDIQSNWKPGPIERRMQDELSHKKEILAKYSLISRKEATESKKYNFILLRGNNSDLIKRVLELRQSWQQVKASHTLFNLKWSPVSKYIKFDQVGTHGQKNLVNHFEYHGEISQKHQLFSNLVTVCEYLHQDVYDTLPVTFIIDGGSFHSQPEFDKFCIYFNMVDKYKKMYQECGSPSEKENMLAQLNQALCTQPNLAEKRKCSRKFTLRDTMFDGQNIWLLKPSDANQGRGVCLFSTLEQLKKLMADFQIYQDILPVNLKQAASEQQPKEQESEVNEEGAVNNVAPQVQVKSDVFIIQKYLEKPLLIRSRKFDIRVWVLVTQDHKCYLFKEGYLRMSGQKYSLNKLDHFMHLTNIAIQKYDQNYGQFEDGNVLSFKQGAELLAKEGRDVDFFRLLEDEMLPQIQLTLMSCRNKLNKNQRKFCFELFGYDFLIDNKLKAWLIEVNTNPSLEQNSMYLKKLIPRMINDTFRMTVDVLFPPETSKINSSQHFDNDHLLKQFDLPGYSDDENLWGTEFSSLKP